MENPQTKFQIGIERLAKTGDDPDMLGAALVSIHGALEDAFRIQLAANSLVPASLRETISDPRQADWKTLLDAMQQYGGLSIGDRRTIWRFNGLRLEFAHGKAFRGQRDDLEAYAAFVEPFLQSGSRPVTTPPYTPPSLASTRPPPVEMLEEPAPRARGAWLVLLALVFALLAGVAYYVLPNIRAPRETAAVARATATVSTSTTPRPTANATPVPPTITPRMATVSGLDGDQLFVREGPSRSAATLDFTLQDGDRVTIVGGPVDADGFTWWNIESEGRRGWCAGAYLLMEQ